MQNEFYVYQHLDPRDDTVRYVGKGKGNRAFRLDCRSGHHKNWIKSLERLNLKPIIEIIEQYKTEQQAFDLEKFWITTYKHAGVKLTNLTSGGEGSSGFKHSKESIEKIKAIKREQIKNPEYRAKMSKNRKGKPGSCTSFKKGHVPLNKKQVIDLSTGIVWDSIMEAAEAYNMKYRTLAARLDGQLKNNTTLTYVEV